ncbi:HD domain-containing protein [Segatella bryantii]|jgi:hypothetical protein|uniref:HD domain-containing protein n=1 Tax=Segatella bryantii TaxID=77095 RepID=UPI00088FB87D|nr:HD domain-containing protein [Segatella bryantii]SDL94263.1 HD domain-containing protein [Segatella bryantii]
MKYNNLPYRPFQPNKLNTVEMHCTQEEFLNILSGVHRQGIINVIHYLVDQTPFFTCPNAVAGDHHHKWEGGLAQHCLGVYKYMLEVGKELIDSGKLSPESIALVGLLHDISKANKFEKLPSGQWIHRRKPLHWDGDGRRSIKLLDMLGLELTLEEREAILCHMHDEIGKGTGKHSLLHTLVRRCDRMDAGRNGR